MLGIGLSHQIVVEGMWGMSYDKPVRHMREYLSILMPLLNDGNVSFAGETLTMHGPATVANPPRVPVMIAALGPAMLRLAGSMTDGTVTWMTGPATLADHIVPSIAKAAADAGRPAPRIGASLPMALTDDPDGARETAAAEFAVYGALPSYRAMLDREGAAGPADVAIVGDEAALRAAVTRLADAGVTDFIPAVFGDSDTQHRTRALLASML
jgi:F420-dependent oxidoreductase-like protein